LKVKVRTIGANLHHTTAQASTSSFLRCGSKVMDKILASAASISPVALTQLCCRPKHFLKEETAVKKCPLALRRHPRQLSTFACSLVPPPPRPSRILSRIRPGPRLRPEGRRGRLSPGAARGVGILQRARAAPDPPGPPRQPAKPRHLGASTTRLVWEVSREGDSALRAVISELEPGHDEDSK
jgi:hypothetical protein